MEEQIASIEKHSNKLHQLIAKEFSPEKEKRRNRLGMKKKTRSRLQLKRKRTSHNMKQNWKMTQVMRDKLHREDML